MAELEVPNLREQAQSALATSPISALRRLHVEKNGTAIVLSGRVRSYYQKQLAQELVRAVASECELINSVHVQ